MNIDAVKQFMRSRFSVGHRRNALMVGMFKVSNEPDANGWVGHVHAIVAGFAKMPEVRAAFRSLPFEDYGYICIEEVRDLPAVLVDVLRSDVRAWQWPRPYNNAERPPKIYRSEFYRWQFRHPASQRTIRYGCDQYFRRLLKTPKKAQATTRAKKKRPYPHWLEKHMYGSHPSRCRCRICAGRR
jgi:hypothetical protein